MPEQSGGSARVAPGEVRAARVGPDTSHTASRQHSTIVSGTAGQQCGLRGKDSGQQ